MKLAQLQEAKYMKNPSMKIVVEISLEQLGELLTDIADGSSEALMNLTDEEFGQFGDKLLSDERIRSLIQSSVDRYRVNEMSIFEEILQNNRKLLILIDKIAQGE